MSVKAPSPGPSPRALLWQCPECKRLNWTCEDLGPNRRAHYGWALHRGETTPPKCLRHAGAVMTLEKP